MKTQAEIQRIHDMLVGILLGEADLGFGPQTMKVISASAHVLCWVLDHEHNVAFYDVLKLIEQEMKERGITLDDHGN